MAREEASAHQPRPGRGDPSKPFLQKTGLVIYEHTALSISEVLDEATFIVVQFAYILMCVLQEGVSLEGRSAHGYS